MSEPAIRSNSSPNILTANNIMFFLTHDRVSPFSTCFDRTSHICTSFILLNKPLRMKYDLVWFDVFFG